MNIAAELNRLLKEYIKNRGYYSSGSLYNSINFNVKMIKGEPDIKLTANDYILYLDNGTLLDDFFSTEPVKDAIGNWMVEELIKSI